MAAFFIGHQLADVHAERVGDQTAEPGLEERVHSSPPFAVTSWRVRERFRRRAGAGATRQSFRQALESLRGLDVGIGAPITFTPERHQGLDSVYFTRVEADRWVPVADWSTAVKA